MRKQHALPSFTKRQQRILAACLRNADDLVGSAELLLAHNKPTIAYHLAVLAIEELGKRQVYGLNAFARSRDDLDPVSSRTLTEHAGKLFWAFFWHQITRESLNQAKIDEL